MLPSAYDIKEYAIESFLRPALLRAAWALAQTFDDNVLLIHRSTGYHGESFLNPLPSPSRLPVNAAERASVLHDLPTGFAHQYLLTKWDDLPQPGALRTLFGAGQKILVDHIEALMPERPSSLFYAVADPVIVSLEDEEGMRDLNSMRALNRKPNIITYSAYMSDHTHVVYDQATKSYAFVDAECPTRTPQIWQQSDGAVLWPIQPKLQPPLQRRAYNITEPTPFAPTRRLVFVASR
ncbi:MAG: hypothetical protein V4621_01485 [Pseudomonadota bacterium]